MKFSEQATALSFALGTLLPAGNIIVFIVITYDVSGSVTVLICNFRPNGPGYVNDGMP
jgi:hypothetical protein